MPGCRPDNAMGSDSDTDSDSSSSDSPLEPPPAQAEPLLARQRRHGGVARWLLRRECAPEAAGGPPFLGVPPRLCTPIQSLAGPGADSLLLRTVVLGYSRCAPWRSSSRAAQGSDNTILSCPRACLTTSVVRPARDGEHLLGYSQQGGQYTIHVWCLCGQGQPAKHLASFPLAEKEATAADSDFLPTDEAEASVMLVTMCELPEGDTLGALPWLLLPLLSRGLSISTLTPFAMRHPPVIHAMPFTDTAGDGDHENVANTGQQGPSAAAPEQRRAFVCVVSTPWSVPATQRNVTSVHMFTYLTSAPNTAFDAALCLRGRLLYLPTGDGLTVVDLAPPALMPHIADTLPRSSSLAKDWCHSDLVTFEPWAMGQCPPVEEEGHVPRLGVKPTLRGRLEAEEHIARSLAAPLANGYRLVDYAVQLIDTVHVPPERDGSHLAALLLCVAALRSTKGLDPQHVRPVALLSGLFVTTHHPHADEEGTRQPQLLRPSITCRLLHSVEMLACSPDLFPSLAAGQAAALRRCCSMPVAAHALPHTVDNMSAIQRWVSASVLRHPSLPLAILGFGVRPPG